MTFTIRKLKRSPSGRESVREVSFDAPQVTIGRDASNDLELPSLRVGLFHAVLKQGDDGNPALELREGNQAAINGRMRRGRTGRLRPGTRIQIGPYELRVEPDSTADHLVFTLEEVETIEIALSGEDEEAYFGLKKNLPSKRLMSWAAFLIIIGAFLYLPIWGFNQTDETADSGWPFQTDLAWNSGPISLVHANLKNDCKSCHTEAFTSVRDAACLECHADLRDHAGAEDMRKARPKPTGFGERLDRISETFGRPVTRCSSCHVEHNDGDKLVPLDQKLCADCHENLDAALPDTLLGNVSDFGANHPQFRPTIITAPDFNHPKTERISLDDNPKGFSGLKFPHKLHLAKDGGVARMAGNLGQTYGFSDGVSCDDCHRPEAGGALFDPVSMQQDCAMCHSLAFEDDDGYMRTLRHGEPNEVIASMRDFYQAKALANIRDAEMNTTTRRRPGRAARLRDLNRRELAFKQADERTAAKVNAIFSEGGACYDCHAIDRPADISTLDFKIRPISVSDAFYPSSPFNHDRHNTANLTCRTCHAAKTSESSADILLPKIAVCRECHIGEESYREGGERAQGTFPTTCLTCHSYHDGPHGDSMKKSTAMKADK